MYPRNIGMSARALANMGGSRMILVAPRCELTVEAKQGAAHAQDRLSNTVVYASLEEFSRAEGDGLRIALSGKDFRLGESEPLDRVVNSMVADREHMIHSLSQPLYLFFGPEDDGLSAEEMAICHHVCSLPTFGEITSLNLSHAVLLALYIVRAALERPAPGATHDSDATLASTQPNARARKIELKSLYLPRETIREWLTELGFDLSHERINIETKLTRMLLSHAPSQDELRLLNTVLHQTVRKLRANSKPK